LGGKPDGDEDAAGGEEDTGGTDVGKAGLALIGAEAVPGEGEFGRAGRAAGEAPLAGDGLEGGGGLGRAEPPPTAPCGCGGMEEIALTAPGAVIEAEAGVVDPMAGLKAEAADETAVFPGACFGAEIAGRVAEVTAGGGGLVGREVAGRGGVSPALFDGGGGRDWGFEGGGRAEKGPVVLGAAAADAAEGLAEDRDEEEEEEKVEERDDTEEVEVGLS